MTWFKATQKIRLGEDRQLPLGSPIDLIWIFREGLGGVKPFLLSQGEMFDFKVTGRLNVDFKALYHILHIFEDFFTSIYCRVMLVHRNVLTDPLKDILNEKNCYISAKIILLYIRGQTSMRSINPLWGLQLVQSWKFGEIMIN